MASLARPTVGWGAREIWGGREGEQVLVKAYIHIHNIMLITVTGR